MHDDLGLVLVRRVWADQKPLPVTRINAFHATDKTYSRLGSMALEALLAASISPDQGQRVQAEHTLSTTVTAIDLVRYVKGSKDSASRLSALVYLKNYVLQHWSAQFAEYKGQLCPEADKHALRHECFGLVGDAERSVRSQAGFITSKIIASDYPDEWATVLDDLLGVLAKPQTEDWLHGALVVMKDFVDDSMSEEQFLPIAQNLVQYLLLITRNGQYRGEIRAQAVDVFISCLDSLDMLSSTRREGIRVFVDNALPPWLDTIVQIINDKNSHAELKIKSIETILKLRLLFPSQLVHFLPAIFTPVYESLQAVDVEDTKHQQTIALQVEFIRKAVQAKIIVETVLAQRPIFEGCVALALKFAQVSQDTSDEWSTDMDGFVEDLEETAFSVRHLCTDLLEDLQKVNPAWTKEILSSAVDHFFVQANTSPRQQEALIFSLIALTERSERLQQILETALGSSDPLLAGRGALYAAQLGVAECFAATCTQLASTDRVLQLCAIKALAKYADTQADLVKGQQAPILQSITSLAPKLPACSLLMIAESIAPIIDLEPSIVLSGNSPLPGLFTILAGNPGDISLVSTVVDIFERLASEVDFEALCTAVLPVLLQTINNEALLRSIAFDILNGIIEGSPNNTLPNGFVDTIWPVFSINMEIEELQTAHEILRNLVKKAWTQIVDGNHVDELLGVIAVALQGEESASFYIPQLVVSLIRQAGDLLSNIMPRLLEIIVQKLKSQGLSTAYQQNLVSVFAEIALSQATPLVDFLTQNGGLEIVMSTWTEVFPDFHGYSSIRTSVVGLSQIHSTMHPSLNIQVKGDLIPDTSGKILTRSRARTNPDRYTSVPLSLKIVKLFIAELVNEMEGKTEDEEIVSDEEWESTDLAKVIEEAQLNEGDRWGEDEDDTLKEINTRQYIITFLRQLPQSTVEQLNDGERETLHNSLE